MTETTNMTVFVTAARQHAAKRSLSGCTHNWLRCPPHMDVPAARYAVRLSFDTEPQPDVLVALFEDFTEKKLPAPPLLTVEALSPSTAIHDLNAKKNKHEQVGVPSYWVIDPLEPSMTAFELDKSSHYQIIAKVAGDEPFETIQPFPVRVVLSELLDRTK